jgi:hypothetical protein
LFLFPHEYMPLGIYITEAIMLSTASLSFMLKGHLMQKKIQCLY